MIREGADAPAECRPPPGVGEVAILGAGFAGLTAGRLLVRAGAAVTVIERDHAVGGLARTIERNGFRFDLGGHRFHTENGQVEALFREALAGDVLEVARSSKILMRGRYFDYPWRPLDALRGFGLGGATAIVRDYVAERIRQGLRRSRPESFEDVIVGRFGRSMFDIFVREYSEKVWGVECGRIAPELAEWRIPNLSVGAAVRDLLAPGARDAVRGLIRKFLYPPLGIGQAAEGLRRQIGQGGRVLTGATVAGLHHSGGRISAMTLHRGERAERRRADAFLSSIPLNSLVHILDPPPPAEILAAADRLRFRDLVTVTVMIDRPRVTDQSWIYVPERRIPFGRIHEPTNWSERMAPEGKTLLVTEHFCFRGDDVWRADDGALAAATIDSLEQLGLLRASAVLDSLVIRVPNAYPIFEIGYGDDRRKICDYLASFANLRVIGRGGMFQYFNMDHAMESGMAAAADILAGQTAPPVRNRGAAVLAGAGR